MATQQPWTPSTGISSYTTPVVEPAKAIAVGTPAPALSGGMLGTAVNSSAATRDVGSNELVSNQIGNIMAADNPMMQRAKSQALQTANARGLLNTSIANENAIGAVIDRATPIAQADAAAYQNVATQNLANQQQTNTFNAQQTQNNNQFNAQQSQQNNQFNATKQQEANVFNATQQNDVLRQLLDQGNKLQLADIEASYKTILQSEASAGSLYQQSVKNISEILQNPDLTPQAKTAAVANQNALLTTGLNILGKIGGLNLDGLLTFPSA